MTAPNPYAAQPAAAPAAQPAAPVAAPAAQPAAPAAQPAAAAPAAAQPAVAQPAAPAAAAPAADPSLAAAPAQAPAAPAAPAAEQTPATPQATGGSDTPTNPLVGANGGPAMFISSESMNPSAVFPKSVAENRTLCIARILRLEASTRKSSDPNAKAVVIRLATFDPTSNTWTDVGVVSWDAASVVRLFTSWGDLESPNPLASRQPVITPVFTLERRPKKSNPSETYYALANPALPTQDNPDAINKQWNDHAYHWVTTESGWLN